MNKLAINILGTACILLLASCTQVMEPVQLDGLSPDASAQEQFEINLQPLTFEAAKSLNSEHYDRFVSKPGHAYSANVVAERNLLKTSFPPSSQNQAYKLGIGDELALIQYADSTSGRIGTDGSLFLIGVGRLDALGREISELRDEVRSVLIRNGKAPNFQLEIKAFNSKKAYMIRDNAAVSEARLNTSAIIPITDQGTTFRELIATAGIAFDERQITIVRVQRKGKTYTFSLADLFSQTAPDIYLQDEDRVFIQNLNYRDGKVFLLGGVSPTIIPIRPEERQTLAEVLFAKNGPLATDTAQRSAVYLLRGRDPVQAYHLDAQNPLRVLVADAVELRPNDIVFVAEQPITTFNRTLASLTPLSILMSDIRNGTIP
jgi:polysaccharide biosynthesis/export protein